MKIKTKLTALLIAMVVFLSLVVVGVVAVKRATINIGGEIAFNAKGVNATISSGVLENCSFTNASDADSKLKSITIDTTRTQSEIVSSAEYLSWSGLSLLFDQSTTFPFVAKIKFTITNNSMVDGEYIKIGITVSEGNGKVLTSASPDGQTINLGETRDCEVVFTISESVTTSLSFNIGFDLELTDQMIMPEGVRYDKDGRYYYVEMGTYNSSPVRWRYVGYVDEKGVMNASSIPNEDYQAIFYQETVATSQVFRNLSASSASQFCANDYSESSIRYGIENTFKNDLSIASNDPIYSKIKARNLLDMYKRLDWNHTTGVVADRSFPIISDSIEDFKLWLMSVEEVYTLVGKGVVKNDNLPADWSGVRDNLAWNSTKYWLRSPYAMIETNAIIVNESGHWTSSNVSESLAVRVAFVMEF